MGHCIFIYILLLLLLLFFFFGGGGGRGGGGVGNYQQHSNDKGEIKFDFKSERA